jgi:hypothetical protein
MKGLGQPKTVEHFPLRYVSAVAQKNARDCDPGHLVPQRLGAGFPQRRERGHCSAVPLQIGRYDLETQEAAYVA